MLQKYPGHSKVGLFFGKIELIWYDFDILSNCTIKNVKILEKMLIVSINNDIAKLRCLKEACEN
jgi:hypothetical protein